MCNELSSLCSTLAQFDSLEGKGEGFGGESSLKNDLGWLISDM